MTIDTIHPTASSLPYGSSMLPESASGRHPFASGADSAGNDNPDPLMTALQQTLAQLAGGNSGDPVVRRVVADANISLASIPRSANPSVNDVETTGAQLLAALYRALALQENAAAASGAAGSSDAGGDGSATLTIAISSPGSRADAYTDLASRIASLSEASRGVVGTDTRDDSPEWDDFADTTPASYTVQYSTVDDSADPDDPMTIALVNLNNALQTHMAALDQDSDSKALLPDVLDSLSGNTVGLAWQPVGGVVDLTV